MQIVFWMDLLTEGNVTIATALFPSTLYFRRAETICILEGKTLGGRTPEELPAASKINMQPWEVSSSPSHSSRYGSGKEAEANSQQLLQSSLWHFSNHPKRVCNHFCHNGFWFTSQVTHTLWLVEGKGKKRNEHYSHYPKITAGTRWMVPDYYPLVLISQQRVLQTWFISEFVNIFNDSSWRKEKKMHWHLVSNLFNNKLWIFIEGANYF